MTRTELAEVHMDGVFDGRNGALEKFNPLASWRSADVWDYIRDSQVPTIHCTSKAMCLLAVNHTRPVAPHEHERAGRVVGKCYPQVRVTSPDLIAHGWYLCGSVVFANSSSRSLRVLQANASCTIHSSNVAQTI